MITEFRGKNFFLPSFFPYVGNQREPVETQRRSSGKGSSIRHVSIFRRTLRRCGAPVLAPETLALSMPLGRAANRCFKTLRLEQTASWIQSTTIHARSRSVALGQATPGIEPLVRRGRVG